MKKKLPKELRDYLLKKDLDVSKYYVGRVCKEGEKHQILGYTLRYFSSEGCIECEKAQNLDRYNKNKEEILKKQTEYRERVRAKRLQQAKEYRERKREQILAYREQNREKNIEYQREYRKRKKLENQ